MLSQHVIEALVVLCTCPDADTAKRLATGMVEADLAACVNIQAGIRSIYRWQGKVEDEAESLMIIKTTLSHYAELETWLREHHPYDVPEILALPVVTGSEPYLAWLTAEPT